MALTEEKVSAVAQKCGYSLFRYDPSDAQARQSWLSADRTQLVALTYLRNGGVSAIKSSTNDEGWAETLLEGPTECSTEEQLHEFFASAP